MKSAEEMMEILEAFDLVGTLRGAAVLAGCDHKTVAHYVALRDAGFSPGGSDPEPVGRRPHQNWAGAVVKNSSSVIRTLVPATRLPASDPQPSRN